MVQIEFVEGNIDGTATTEGRLKHDMVVGGVLRIGVRGEGKDARHKIIHARLERYKDFLDKLPLPVKAKDLPAL